MKRLSIFAFLAISCFTSLFAQTWDYDSTNDKITTMSPVGIGVPSWTDLGDWSLFVKGNSIHQGAIQFYGFPYSNGMPQGMTMNEDATFQYNTENAVSGYTNSHNLFSDGFGFYQGYSHTGAENVTKSYVSSYWGIDFFTGDNRESKDPALTINRSGYIGIRSQNPEKPLTIVGGSWDWNIMIADADEENIMYMGWHEGRQMMEIAVRENSNWGKVPLGIGSEEVFFSKNVGIGVTTLKPDYALTVKGKVVCEEVQVELSGSDWGDYVFEEDYDLTSLEETEAFITKNKHLPGIPSADSITANGGIAIGEMQKMQMVKIEELTLHVIEMNKEKKSLEKENKELSLKLELLEERLEKLSELVSGRDTEDLDN